MPRVWVATCVLGIEPGSYGRAASASEALSHPSSPTCSHLDTVCLHALSTQRSAFPPWLPFLAHHLFRSRAFNYQSLGGFCSYLSVIDFHFIMSCSQSVLSVTLVSLVLFDGLDSALKSACAPQLLAVKHHKCQLGQVDGDYCEILLSSR